MTTDVADTVAPSPSESPAPGDRAARPGSAPRRPVLLALLIAGAFFAAVAPTLRWQEFSGGSENLVVETRDPNDHAASELLITDLHNYGMPFVRYASGDLGKITPQIKPYEVQ